jgi:hypothetical protein
MTEMARLPMPTTYTVYGVYDGPEIVYVGLTTNLTYRESQHRATSPWCCERHVFIPLSKHINNERTAELKAIDLYRPMFNIRGNHGIDWREAS